MTISLRLMLILKDKVMNLYYQDRIITDVKSPCFKGRNSFDSKLKVERKKKKAATFHQLLFEKKGLKPSKVLPYFTVFLFAFLFFFWTQCLIQRQIQAKDVRALEIGYSLYPVDNDASKTTVSLVILISRDIAKLSALLHSITNQPKDFYEIIMLDVGCDPQTAHLILDIFPNIEDRMHHKYSRQCDPKGYAAMNDLAVDMASKTSKWILFLDENIILQGSTFITDLLELGESQPRAGAVGCKLLSRTGHEVVAAGNIIWSDGSASRFGLNNTDTDSSEFSYPRPVDYMSGACLMVKKDIISKYDGFDAHYLDNDYQVRDLQMFVQHILGKDVWYQPKSVAFYDDENSPVATDEIQLNKSHNFFQDKWKKYLTKYSFNPHILSEDEKQLALLRASDVRAKDSAKVNILYLDSQIPSKSFGAGFGRAFDNLEVLAGLGYKITVLSYNLVTQTCDETCLREIRDLSIEVVTGPWNEFLEQRGSLYEVIIVSRPPILRQTYKNLRELYKKNPFTLIFDCEALWYRRDEIRISVIEQGINLPSYSVHNNGMDIEDMKLIAEIDKKDEHKLFFMADIIVPVSEEESDIISMMHPNVQVEIIGHISDNKQSPKSFHEREGILYLASFHGSMYYNGDAIWYFLKEIYPLVLNEAPSPIHLTIAGRGIPDELRMFTKMNGLDQFVKFVDSPKDVVTLYEKARIFIAPHLYGAGIQFKLSEAIGYGIPTVLSKFSAASFRISEDSDISCVGKDVQSFKKCVIDVYNDKTKWDRIQKNGFNFVHETFNKKVLQRTWSKLIESSKNMFNKRKNKRTDKLCVEGEESYRRKYPDVAKLVEKGIFGSAFGHWKYQGKLEGRNYVCEDEDHPLFAVDVIDPPQCPEGEALYMLMFQDIVTALEKNIYKSAHDHWVQFGAKEGRRYYCRQ